ncbi:uncharacterized protein LOC130893889 isoform X1 [Diorhabda carinulata]|uniref:uncharacterized protein LOC130893889 isoform X1 n=1 Tax=Diorhabda carinulata TaxID=1163345 RepID=UPI0025A08650|nr:uncharacterized protein LOC130893889 isoform X1 [Diorhabda carinulata]
MENTQQCSIPEDNSQDIIVSKILKCGNFTIIVDDVDDKKNSSQAQTKNETRVSGKPETTLHNVENPYPKQVLDDAIRDILKEAELRKFEFRKLLDEHDALVENLKKMENDQPNRRNFINNVAKSPISA